MTWTSTDINDQAKRGNTFIQHYYRDQPSIHEIADGYRIAIVGAGPKGLYALDSLCKQFSQAAYSKKKIQVYWYNKDLAYGSGPNYRISQPEYLLINYCIAHIDAWEKCTQRSDTQLDLLHWIQKYSCGEQQVHASDYASRALVGHYLQYAVMQVIQRKPANLQLQLVPEQVGDIRPAPKDLLVVHSPSMQQELHQVLLATGHCYRNAPYLDFGGRDQPATYIAQAYPVEALAKIPAGSRVGILGWGLTFIDAALQLSEGRGGRFDAQGNYQASGQEPILLPFSRHHLPILTRGPVHGSPAYQLHYLDKNRIAKLDDIRQQRKIDFNREILPLLEEEVRFAYYSTFLQSRSESVIASYLHNLSTESQFGWFSLLFSKIPKKGSLQASYIQHINTQIAEAEKGIAHSPLMAAAAIWQLLSPTFSRWYAEGGLTGISQAYFDQQLFGAICRTSYGPPIGNMKKIRGLLQADIIQTVGEGTVSVSYKPDRASYKLQDQQHQEELDYLIDARIARPNLQAHNSAFYQRLWQNGLIRPYENEGYRPGTAESLHPNLYAYGSNTEGILHDNDSLSRGKNNILPSWLRHVATHINHHHT